jgi:hypothetical protein
VSARTYVIVVIGALFALAMILRRVRHRRLRAKYALLWMCFGVGLFLLAIIPQALDRLASLAGVAYPPALLLVLGLGFFAVLCLHLSTELSRLEERTRVLAEETAMIREILERTYREESSSIGRADQPVNRPTPDTSSGPPAA